MGRRLFVGRHASQDQGREPEAGRQFPRTVAITKLPGAPALCEVPASMGYPHGRSCATASDRRRYHRRTTRLIARRGSNNSRPILLKMMKGPTCRVPRASRLVRGCGPSLARLHRQFWGQRGPPEAPRSSPSSSRHFCGAGSDGRCPWVFARALAEGASTHRGATSVRARSLVVSNRGPQR